MLEGGIGRRGWKLLFRFGTSGKDWKHAQWTYHTTSVFALILSPGSQMDWRTSKREQWLGALHYVLGGPNALGVA